jgi:hypothetical protein
METITNEISLRDVVALLDDRKIAPDAEFTAAAGVDYGQVRVWGLAGMPPRCLVESSDNGETHYSIEHPDDCGEADLPAYRLDDYLDGYARYVERANVLGSDAVMVEAAEALAEHDGPVAVLRTSYLYGPTEQTDLYRDDMTPDEARALVAEQEEGSRYCGHNESSPARLWIVPA